MRSAVAAIPLIVLVVLALWGDLVDQPWAPTYAVVTPAPTPTPTSPP
jgi:hypothetical protein